MPVFLARPVRRVLLTEDPIICDPEKKGEEWSTPPCPYRVCFTIGTVVAAAAPAISDTELLKEFATQTFPDPSTAIPWGALNALALELKGGLRSFA